MLGGGLGVFGRDIERKRGNEIIFLLPMFRVDTPLLSIHGIHRHLRKIRIRLLVVYEWGVGVMDNVRFHKHR